MQIQTRFFQFYLRISIAVGYLVPALDRLGVWGRPGDKNISWGDWTHFLNYATEVMSFLPLIMVKVLAILATAAEISIGALLLIGKWIRLAAIGSGILSFIFALSMAISFGIVSPIIYSVFVLSASSFLLSTLENNRSSVDKLE